MLLPYQFQSTPSARRATERFRRETYKIVISIHALREEGDLHKVAVHGLVDISIHPLRVVGDASTQATGKTYTVFQSTPSARRATLRRRCRVHDGGISIHALREEGDAR